MSLRRLCALLAAAAACALSAQALPAQAVEAPVMEVQQSSGFVEVLLPDLGWRQAVIGRQVPVDSVITSWTGAHATVGFGDCTITVDQLSHLAVVSLSDSLIRISLQSGGIEVAAPTGACEVEFRGMVIRIEKGTASLDDGILTVQAGSALIDGAGAKPVPVAPGRTVSLLSPAAGPVFVSDR